VHCRDIPFGVSSVNPEADSIEISLQESLTRLRPGHFTPALLSIVAALACFCAPAKAQNAVEDRLIQSYRDVYNVRFQDALQQEEEAKKLAPDDPMPWIAQANVVLFREFDRLHVLRSETFASDDNYTSRQSYRWDPASYQAFQNALNGAEQLAQKRLERNKNDDRALLALALSNSMRAEDAALFAKKDMATLSYFHSSTSYAERLLAIAPEKYDAYLASGLGKYVIGCKSAPVRWVLRAGGMKGDREEGVRELSVAAAHAIYMAPFARLLLAYDDLRRNNRSEARKKFAALHDEFPNNPMFLQETARLDSPSPSIRPGQ
jgi:hypothetical protein